MEKASISGRSTGRICPNMTRERDRATTDEACHEFHVVGIGASAGGLEALESFFRAMPADSGLAFVVIQHLSPDFKSHMEELLSRQTSIPVRSVTNAMTVEPNTIYLIPAKMEMVISEGKLLLTQRNPDRAFSHPIDQFFRSLSSDVGRYAIGVVLSGTGTDGSRGIRDIHEAGGLVVVQDTSTAKFDGMPISAMDTGVVDVVLPPTAIAEALIRYAHDGVTREKLAEEDLALATMDGGDQIFGLLNRKYGLDFSQYKATTVGRRINRRIQLLRLENVGEYVKRLSEDDVELNELYKDLLIGVTKFFRDPDAFDSLKREVISKLCAKTDRDDGIRIWVAACASGEEAYSIAILVDEELRQRDVQLDVKIFATDAHSGSLQTAAKGLYPEDALSEMSVARRDRYFRRVRDGYQVTRELRDYIVFAPQNLISDAPFTQMDLVTCRNMLIYLQPQAQKKAISLFHFAIKPSGALFLGPSETPGELLDEFQVIDKRWRIYTKRRDVRLPVAVRSSMARRHERLPHITLPVTTSRVNRIDQELIATYDQLLAKKMGCSILVNDRGEILHVFGGAEKYLKPRGGRPSNHILEQIHESLRGSVSAAWHHAANKHNTVRFASANFNGGTNLENIRITIEPLGDEAKQPQNVLIEFAVAGVKTPPPEMEASLDQLQMGRIDSLETELRYSEENLQATIEEMETSNEELQAANEELIAANEELQSTNEELHSVNEELYTVNAEHQRRVEELAQANDDMDNLLATTRVGVIFLDEALYIRRFTPEIARVFHLDNNDTGRSMEHFAHVLNRPTLVDDLRLVLADQVESEYTVSDHSGTPYLLRILPYQSGDTTRGLVMTLIDISTLSKAEAEIHLLQLAIESAVNGIIITNPQIDGDPIVYANRGFLQLTGYDHDEVIGRNCRFLQGEDTSRKSVALIREALAREEPIRTTLLNYRKDGTPFFNDLQITPVRNPNGELINFIGVQHDVSDQINIQNALEDANEAAERANKAKSSFLATMSHELRTPLTAMLGFADILRSETEDPLTIDKVETIKRNGVYLLALLNDILDLSKIEAGKLQFEQRAVNIRELMCELETLMQNRSSRANVPLRFEFATQLPSEITADDVRVRQILVNLISNAIKFTEKGEVVVTTTMNHEVSPSRLEIAVVDTGIGISKKQIGKLFTPFNQATKQTTRHFGGTGLGLSISKRLAEGMGGAIQVSSDLGKGSCFTLLLPVTASQGESLTEMSASADGRMNFVTTLQEQPTFPKIDAKILLADDRRDVWRVGKHFLEKCGADVTIAENGQQAVDAVERANSSHQPFALVLMDMQMPVMSGREAVAKLREQGYKKPIVALTADAMEGEREACIAMGCDEYFPKPIDGPRLMNLIASLLENHPT